MLILLDTHYLLWAVDVPERLPAAAQDALRDQENTVYFSAASIWEIAIKAALRRQDFQAKPEVIGKAARDVGFEALPVTWQHTCGVAALANYHKDPFDKLLIAQAMALPARLLTADARLPRYSELVWLEAV
jgi:PIN domain nuclease of toxin-antitoxin system